MQVVVFSGGSFATAMGAALARQKASMDVVMLMRDAARAEQINAHHQNMRYLPGAVLPSNLRATTDAAEAIAGAQFAIHAVPVQATRKFLAGIRDMLPPDVPVICVSKGIEQLSTSLLSDVIPDALGRPQPCVFLSGPSFAKEVCSAPVQHAS
jgi:glycerol-3-phosphate dehydrogenase (NAD+)